MPIVCWHSQFVIPSQVIDLRYDPFSSHRPNVQGTHACAHAHMYGCVGWRFEEATVAATDGVGCGAVPASWFFRQGNAGPVL